MSNQKSTAAKSLLTVMRDDDLESVLSEEHSSQGNDDDDDDKGSTTASGSGKETTSGNTDKDAVESQKLQVAKAETSAVLKLRLLVFFVLFLAAAAGTCLLQYFTSTLVLK